MPFDKSGKWIPSEELAEALETDAEGFEYIADEALRAITSAGRDVAENTMQSGLWVADKAIEIASIGYFEGLPDQRAAILPETLRPQSMGGKMAEEVLQFGAGALGVQKFTKVGQLGATVGKKLFRGRKTGEVLGEGAAIGAVGDMIVSNPYEDRLANVLTQTQSPILNNSITQYLQAERDDSFFEAKMKTAIEGGVLGAAADGVITLVMGIKRLRKAVENGEDTKEITEQLDNDLLAHADNVDAENAAKSGEADQVAATVKAEQEAKGQTNTEETVKAELSKEEAQALAEAAENVAPEGLEATRLTIKADLSKRMDDLPDDLNGTQRRERMIKIMPRKEMVETAEALGIKLTKANSKNKKVLFQTIVDNLYKGVDEAQPLPKPPKKSSGVQEPKPSRKLTPKQVAKIAQDPKNLSKELSKMGIMSAKYFDPTSPASVKNFIEGLIKANKKAFKDVKGSETNEEFTEDVITNFAEMADMSNAEVSKMMSGFAESTKESTRSLAVAESMVKAQFEELFDKVVDPRLLTSKEFSAEVMQNLEESLMLLKSIQGLESQYGRALRLRGRPVLEQDFLRMNSLEQSAKNADLSEFDELLKSYGGIDGLKQLQADFRAAGKGNHRALIKRTKRTQETTGTKVGRSVVELFRSMILFNTKTHVTNILSGTAESAIGPLEGLMGTVLTPKMFSAENVHARKFFVAQLQGLFFSMDEAWKQAGRAFTHERNLLDTLGKVDDITQQNKITSQYWEGAKDTALGGFLDYTGKATRMSLRALGAEDEFFKQLNYRSYVFAKAKLDGQGMGLKGDELSEYVAKEIDDSFDVNGAAAAVDGKFKYSNALDHARRVTFTQELRKGSRMRGFHEAVTRWPLAQMVLPFIRTPTNLLLTAVQRTPVLNYASKDFREMLQSSDPVIRSKARGKFSTGVMLYGGILSLIAQGRITGNGPQDKQQNMLWRQAGNQPYSMKVGDQWVSYLRLDPNFVPFAVVANAYDAFQYHPKFENFSDVWEDVSAMDEGSLETGSELVVAAFLALTKSIEDKAYFQGAAQLVSSLTSDNPAQESQLQRMLSGYATSFVPSAPEQVASALREMMKDQPNEVREAIGLFDKIKRKTALHKELPVKYNWLSGQPMINHGYFTGIPVVEDQSNAVFDELVRLEVGIAPPSRKFGDLGIDLNTEEYAAYLKNTGTLKIGGYTLLENLNRLFTHPSYEKAAYDFELTKEGYSKQAELVRKIVSQHKALAREQMLLDFPDLKKEFVTRKIAKTSGFLIDDLNR
jgi:hypothetical protein